MTHHVIVNPTICLGPYAISWLLWTLHRRFAPSPSLRPSKWGKKQNTSQLGVHNEFWKLLWFVSLLVFLDQIGSQETFEFIRGHRFFGPPYDREFRWGEQRAPEVETRHHEATRAGWDGHQVYEVAEIESMCFGFVVHTFGRSALMTSWWTRCEEFLDF